MGSKTYGPDLHYDIHHPGVAEEWMRKFPGKNWPVLAFTGAPASFPVQEQNVALHGHLFGKWAEELDNKVSLFSTFYKGFVIEGFPSPNDVEYLIDL